MNKAIKAPLFLSVLYLLSFTNIDYSQNLNSDFPIWSSISRYEVDTISGYYFNANPFNPFGPSTFLHFFIPKKNLVRISLMDTLLNNEYLILNLEIEKGFYVVHWDVSKVKSGKYSCKLETTDYSKSEIYYVVR